MKNWEMGRRRRHVKIATSKDELHEEESPNLEELRLFDMIQEGKNQEKLSP